MNAVSTKLNSVRRPNRRRGLGAVVSSGAGLFFLLTGGTRAASLTITCLRSSSRESPS